ncbi:PSD1 and planctomycete cytochrome C domain-containing protein [Algoriphagus sp.]|uniref:PSD1 and planctomycete cytochrome C domain-containing protein n=1 Tax=Algoriphagus sp. TaxID=1872435 RepID=UPI0027183471|nr:PSD1 and planctomycete cytochrome C domain-containing protein [Algoriphagus sp.]MDO8967574.1 PSD1 and planctomycete cytochrome C domain-containing protein [Algoriphagus sp.]MDP3198625.1 PSD1 and planctomycete cytochrome C domain-containing protein [Algoriphagus sp.]
MNRNQLVLLLSLLVGISLIGFFFFGPEKEVDYSTQIKPILNKHCITCHGGVKKNGGFSILFEEEAFALNESGLPAIVPGSPNSSELIKRLTHSDPELRMPYQKAALSDEEIDLLKTWIRQGAKWGKHWAYKPVQKPAFTSQIQSAGIGSTNSGNAISPIDHFIREKLEVKGLIPSAEEQPLRLLRRVALDLTGLPPSETLVSDFSSGKITYNQAVDQLLKSDSFGEKWATWWLDLARYADTKGYERDVSRTMWPYRDWVIRAFNTDKPFDEFTIEQLAGDLLPNPTQDQLTATAFHRNTMNNDEGGTEDEEFRVAAVLDRVNTTYEVWQSTTIACVQCHSHTYDPIRHEEFYQSAAFFNNTRDEDTHDEEPRLRFYEPEQQSQIDAVINWVKETEGEKGAKARSDFLKFYEPKYAAHLATDFNRSELIDTKWLGLWSGGSAVYKNIDTQGSDQLLLDYWTGLDGTEMTIRKDGAAGEILASFVMNKTQGEVVRQIPFKPISGKVNLHIEAKNPSAGPQQNTSTIVWFAFVPSLKGKEKPGFAASEKTWEELLKFKGTRLPILIENPPYMARKTNVFERGNWMVLGEEVKPKTPDELGGWKEQWPNNRLGFAYWLTSLENPLTARTLINRVWDQLFGRGIVRSLEDMGSQSDPPTHPELLDYLAWKTMNDYDWSMKSLIREIVTSTTYKQSSVLSAEVFEKDPENQWYSRGPRFRLSAEQVRDQALAVSGLLSQKMYGPGVKPHQPEGIWQTVYNGESWKESEGEDKYRRGIYTFLKRTSPYPSFITFDAASREVCLSKRLVTNTPLQALVTLNDPVYLEAAKNLGKNTWEKSGENPEKAISAAYEKLILSPISEGKKKTLLALFASAKAEFTKDPKALNEFYPGAKPEVAAMSVVANAMMNLDEFLTKP